MTLPARLLRSAQRLCLLSIVASSSSMSAQLTFEYGGVEREYYLDLPLNLSDSAPQIDYLNGDHVDFGQACHVRAYDSLGRQLWARQVLSGDRITPADLRGALVLQLIGENGRVQALRIR